MSECVRVSVCDVCEWEGGKRRRRRRKERCSTKNKNPTRQCGEKDYTSIDPKQHKFQKNHMSALCHAHRFLWFPCMGLCSVMSKDLRLCVFFLLAPPCPPPMIPIKYHVVVDSCTCNVIYINYRAGAPIYYCNVMTIDYCLFISIE